MKKIISILIALVLALSLTACGGSGGGEGTTNNPLKKSTLSKYVNEDALSNTDNITISIGKTEKENEEYILNINAPDLLKDLKAIEDNYGGSASRLANDIINLRLFRNSDARFSDAYFSFNGYGEFIITSRNASTNTIQGETILEDGCLLLVKDGNSHQIWVKDNDIAIAIDVDGKYDEESDAYYRIRGEEEHKALFNMIKEHFTFAKISTKKIEKNGINFTAYDPKTIAVLGESVNTTNWVFACDVLYKEIEKMGVSLITSHCLFSDGNRISALCPLGEKTTETEESKSIEITFSSIYDETFATANVENEFAIGGIQFREDTEGPSRSNGIGFIIKNSSGSEYVCDVYPRGSIDGTKLDLNTAKEYLEKIIIAK
jgi:hypothetical protein